VHPAGCNAPVARKLREIEARSDRDIDELGILARNQNKAVTQQIDARLVLDDLLLRAVIHPVEVGGSENIGRRALLNLLHQCRAGRIARSHLDASALGKRRIDIIKGIFH
jgi:hypothetical protein